MTEAETHEVSWEDLVPKADPAQALEFLDQIHRDASGRVALTIISRNTRKAVKTGTSSWTDARAEITRDPEWWRFCEDDYARWDTYTAVCSFAKAPERGSRGLKKDALETPGVFADLDVKPDQPGAFRNHAELETFLGRLPEPTLRVATGSGGEHVYWLCTTRVPILDVGERLLDGWYDYLCAVAGEDDRVVDHVQEASRILRVPGTIRWPKARAADVGVPRAVTLTKVDGPRYDASVLLELTEPYRQAAVAAHEDGRGKWNSGRGDAVAGLEKLSLPSVQRAFLEETFNKTEDWERLLVGKGWTLVRDRRDGSGTSTDCRYWCRPGKDPAEGWSASTDSPRGRPGTMFVYTTDPEMDRCLIPEPDRFKRITTKYFFALWFWFDGNEAALLESIVRGKGRLNI